ncbi:hypothetical protein [Pseudomonas lundensis]|uniref:hypothetical protein n=1 Tax=Pseudomonas lundensis TaxID=86185 RepID=UPI00201E0925|nr:hypothetical protein [Pseudomonas lundensis]
MLLPSASEVIAVAIGADAGLARVASDGTFHTDKQLCCMCKATTRVRFQFRRSCRFTAFTLARQVMTQYAPCR